MLLSFDFYFLCKKSSLFIVGQCCSLLLAVMLFLSESKYIILIVPSAGNNVWLRKLFQTLWIQWTSNQQPFITCLALNNFFFYSTTRWRYLTTTHSMAWTSKIVSPYCVWFIAWLAKDLNVSTYIMDLKFHCNFKKPLYSWLICNKKHIFVFSLDMDMVLNCFVWHLILKAQHLQLLVK